MTNYLVHRTDQVGSVAQAARAFLESRPVEHNLILTLLRQRIASPEPGRYWWITESGEVRGVALQSPITFRAVITPVPLGAVGPLVEAVAAVAPDLPGVGGEAATTAAFAGAWTEHRGVSAQPVVGERLYRLDTVVPAVGVAGSLRVATADDLALVTEWFVAFDAGLGTGSPARDLAAVAATRVAAGEVGLWDVGGEAVSVAMITAPIAGASRIGYVYTPPEHRRRGYAAATVAGLCRTAMADRGPLGRVDVCLLYTELHNATSNGIYRRIGFRSVSEGLVYAFEPA